MRNNNSDDKDDLMTSKIRGTVNEKKTLSIKTLTKNSSGYYRDKVPHIEESD